MASFEDTATRTEVLSTVVSANTNTDVDFAPGTINDFVSKGYNLIGDGNATAAYNQTGDKIIGNDPAGLGLLANNGGPTETHALLATSPAIDAGQPVQADTNGISCPPPATDQRGVSRPKDGNGDGDARCDIGAFELDNSAPEAKDDAYSTDEDTTLTVGALDGVLENDTDADNDTLTVGTPRPVSGPTNGSLTLNSDGSFTYTPTTTTTAPILSPTGPTTARLTAPASPR